MRAEIYISASVVGGDAASVASKIADALVGHTDNLVVHEFRVEESDA